MLGTQVRGFEAERPEVDVDLAFPPRKEVQAQELLQALRRVQRSISGNDAKHLLVPARCDIERRAEPANGQGGRPLVGLEIGEIGVELDDSAAGRQPVGEDEADER